MLTVLEQLPENFLTTPAHELYKILQGPTLIHLKGKNPQPIYVSVLIHGNETTGFEAMQNLLLEYQNKTLPRSLSLFVGNIAAAKQNVRHLDHQPDYNRIWTPGHLPEHALAKTVFNEMREKNPLLCIDFHNNTGHNPHYSVLTDLSISNLYLASLFSKNVLYFTRIMGAKMAAFNDLCPALGIECGKVGHNPRSIAEAKTYIDTLLQLEHLDPAKLKIEKPIQIYHTLATLRVPRSLNIAFGDPAADLCFIDNLDHLNFKEVPEQTVIGWRKEKHITLEALDEKGNDISSQFFEYRDNEILTAVPVTPAMLTQMIPIIKHDCLGYFLETMPLPTYHQ